MTNYLIPLEFEAFQKRVTLTKNDIFSDFSSSRDYARVSFRSVLNRLTILVQYPVCFSLYEKNDNKISLRHHFLQDCLYTEKINNITDDIQLSLDEYLFKIFDSNYYLVIYKIEKGGGEKSGKVLPIKCTFDKSKFIARTEKCKKDDTEYYFEKNGICTIDDYIRLCCRNIFRIGVDIKNTSYDKLIIRSVLGLTLLSDDGNNHISKDNFIDRTKEIFFQSLSGDSIDEKSDILFKRPACFDTVYKNLKKRLSLSANMIEESLSNENVEIFEESKKLPNIFFTVRYYNDNSIERFDGKYNYDLKFIITKEQKSDMREHLLNLKNELSKPQEKYLPYAIYCKKTRKLNELDEVKRLDAEFLKKLMSDDDGIEEILEIFQKPVGSNTRSITDRVFSDGLLYYYIPFTGITRALNGDDDDKLRVVVFYYLALLALPKITENQYIEAIMTPVILSDSVWGVFTHFVVMEESDTYFTNKNIWFSNYRHCNSVSERAEHNIATETRLLYLYWLGEIYSDTFNEITRQSLYKPESSKQEFDVLTSKLYKLANEKFFSLSYFFPYSSVEVTIKFSVPKSKPKNSIYIFNKKGIVLFNIIKNNFFPKPVKEFQMYDITLESLISVFEIRQRRIEDSISSFFKLINESKGDSIH